MFSQKSIRPLRRETNFSPFMEGVCLRLCMISRRIALQSEETSNYEKTPIQIY